MDPLSNLVDRLMPEDLSWKHLIGGADWTVSVPPESGIVFGMVLDGEAWAECGKTVTLEAGDYLLLVNPSAWLLGAGNGGPLQPFPEARNGTVAPAGTPSNDHPQVRIVAGHFHANPASADLLRSLLPGIIQVGGAGPHGTRLRGLLELIDEEMQTGQIGQEAIVRRLLEMMLIEGLRAKTRTPSDADVGLLRGLAEPRLAKVLQAVHNGIADRWSVDALAAIAGMSRSSFSEHFTKLVGISPIAYISAWRFAFARDALRQTADPISEIALRSGYSSTSAFSNAFRSALGIRPADYRSQLEGQGLF